MTENWKKIYQDIEDLLFPQYKIDVQERALYYYLLRQTRLHDVESTTIPIPQMASALDFSNYTARGRIRSLNNKGCIKIEQTRKGYIVKVLLPEELGLEVPQKTIIEVDIETLDFFTSRKYVTQLIKREQGRCFYCLKEISTDTCELDHVIPQVNDGNNSYKNIVAACHKCNTRKQGQTTENFLRSLYRQDLLSDVEFEDRLKALEALRSGKLVPEI
jgi:predicted DNA-binding transcriptional regulator